MNKLTLLGAGGAIALMLAVSPVGVHAATTSAADLLSQIAALQQQIKDLQGKIGDLRGQQQDLKVELRADLKEGMSDEDIKEVQELLASDPDIYPKGLITGYFGPLTKDALKRFQAKAGLTVNGEVDADTREYLQNLLDERFDGKVPPGLLRAPGIWKKVEMRMEKGCDEHKGLGVLCSFLKHKNGNDDDQGDDHGHHSTSTTDGTSSTTVRSISVKVDNAASDVRVGYKNGSHETFHYTETDKDDLISDIADELDMSESAVEDMATFTEVGDVDKIEVDIDTDAHTATSTVTYDNDHEVEFTHNTSSKSTIINDLSNKLDISKSNIEDLIDYI